MQFLLLAAFLLIAVVASSASPASFGVRLLAKAPEKVAPKKGFFSFLHKEAAPAGKCAKKDDKKKCDKKAAPAPAPKKAVPAPKKK